MENKENRKEEDKNQMKGTVSDNQNKPDSSTQPSGKKHDDDEVVKDENIPVTYINTAPEDIPKKS
ncbi:hypothetical protein [Pontibacter brevis]